MKASQPHQPFPVPSTCCITQVTNDSCQKFVIRETVSSFLPPHFRSLLPQKQCKKKTQKKTWSRYDALPASFLGRFENDDLAPDICITFLFVCFVLALHVLNESRTWMNPPPIATATFYRIVQCFKRVFFSLFSLVPIKQTNEKIQIDKKMMKKKKMILTMGMFQTICKYDATRLKWSVQRQKDDFLRLEYLFVLSPFFPVFFSRSYRTVIICLYPFFLCVCLSFATLGGKKRTVDLIAMKICVPILILLPLHTWALSLFCNAVARYLNMYSGKSSCRLELSALFLNPHNVWVINVTVNNSRGGSKLCMFIYPAVTSFCLCLLSEFYVCVRVIMMRMWHTNVALSCSYSFPSRSNMKR